MHERSIFKHGVSYTELGEKYDFFRPHLIKVGKEGKCILNFDDDDAVRELNRALLLEYFNLNVDIPPNCLIPRIPLRLNYILWIEDLLAEFKDIMPTPHVVTGLDIGTGPCAIYAILSAIKNGWVMHGTEMNSGSVKWAENIVKTNNLQEKVKIHQTNPNSLFAEIYEKTKETFAFSMCNPPFFADGEDDLMRPDQANIDWEVKSQIQEEIVCPGSEVKFLEEMILQSSKNRNVVKIFTTMVGVKKHLSAIILTLKKFNINNFVTSVFQQGRTSRWGLAWSWEESINLKRCSQKKQKSSQLEGRLHNIKSFQAFIVQLVTALKSLQMKVECKSSDTMYVTCEHNTWSHSRRKRRMNRRSNTSQEQIPLHCARELEKSDNDDAPPTKFQRRDSSPDCRDDGVDELTSKHESNGLELNNRSATSLTADSDENQVQASSNGSSETKSSFKLVAVRERCDVILKMEYLTGTLGKDGIHQILQYLKNQPFI